MAYSDFRLPDVLDRFGCVDLNEYAIGNPAIILGILASMTTPQGSAA